MRYDFANCILDTDTQVLRVAGAPVPVEPQVFDLIRVLAENPGKVISKDELIDTVWGGRIVSDATISARINAARRAVGDSGEAQAIIRTHPRRGFSLVAPATNAPDADAPAPRPSQTRQVVRYTTSADGTGIAYAISGDGPPLLRAGHHVTHLEFDWESPLWRPHFDALGAAHTLIRYDIRGTGLSDVGPEDAGIAAHVDDLTAVADAAGLDRFPLFATLQGVAVAIRFAAQFPERVSHLILQQGYARGRALRGDRNADQDADPVVSLLRGGGWGDPANGFMRAWTSLVNPTLSPEETTVLIELIARACTTDKMIETRKSIDRFDARAYLDKVRAPTLVLHNRNSALHPLDEARRIASGIAGAEFRVFDSSNTLCVASDPTFSAQNAAILEFLARPGD